MKCLTSEALEKCQCEDCIQHRQMIKDLIEIREKTEKMIRKIREIKKNEKKEN